MAIPKIPGEVDLIGLTATVLDVAKNLEVIALVGEALGAIHHVLLIGHYVEPTVTSFKCMLSIEPGADLLIAGWLATKYPVVVGRPSD
ncbi:MAG: hypothetical protein OXE86_00170 [Alphaproteobacteria bacterium]|nr:hypothetical protein [Alphaproteobacteria bacterium]